jgi:glycerol kinase
VVCGSAPERTEPEIQSRNEGCETVRLITIPALILKISGSEQMKEGDLSWLVRELHAVAGDLDEQRGPEPLILAIDQGGHASRVIAFDIRGSHQAESFTPISTFRAGTDRVEHDPLEVRDSIRTSLEDIAHTLGEDAERVIAIGMATQRSSVVCWDRRTGKPLSPVLSWQDRRNAPLIEHLHTYEQDVRRRTGLVLSPHYGASKLRWCLDELSAVRKAQEEKRLGAGPLASYLLFALLEERPYLVDPANASRTQLFEPHRRNWSEHLGKLFGVPIDLLPRCVPTRHAYGQLSFAGKRLPLVICTGDQSAAAFAYGKLDPATIYLNLGTGGFLQRAGEAEDMRLLRSISYSDDQQVIAVQEGTVNGAASALDWLNERIGIDTHRAALALTRANAGATPPVFINGIGGVGSPYWGNIQSRFTSEASEALQVQAVVESVAFLVCRNIERMVVDGELTRVLASGGLSASDYLCECIASLSGLSVQRASLKEATALGLTFLIAGQPESWNPPIDFEQFAPQAEDKLLGRYRQWCELMSMPSEFLPT